MVLPARESIETFMNITGASEDVAVRKLEEHGGDLNDAVNAHFNEGERDNSNEAEADIAVHEDMMDVDEPVSSGFQHPASSLISSARNLFSLLDPTNHGSLLGGGSDVSTTNPIISHPREVREIPIEVKDREEPFSNSHNVPTIEDVTDAEYSHVPETHGTVIIDDEDDTDISSGPRTRDTPSAPEYDTFADYSNDIEEEMIKAAIEASKRDAEKHSYNNQELPSGKLHMDDHEPSHVACSHKEESDERGIHRSSVKGERGSYKSALRKDASTSNGRLDERSPFIHDLEESSIGISRHDADKSSQQNGNNFHLDEWGGISSEEHDEAVMLEAAMFGGIPERSAIHDGSSSRTGPNTGRTTRIPSPSLESQRLIREQQDDEYLASLQADQEKELKAIEEAEFAIAEEKRKEEESWKRIEQQQEMERQLAAKEATLPQEPSPDDENAVTLLVRMPDGTRRGRRFLKLDKLQSLLDFIDVGGIKPGSYKLVRPYPRKAFGDGERACTLNELGLTSKQEALFLEII